MTGVRVEWLKARARAQRWEEEVRMLRAEMNRVLEFFSWKATWWATSTTRTSVSPQLGEGLTAYAAEQADMYRRIRVAFETLWQPKRDVAALFLARQSVLDEL